MCKILRWGTQGQGGNAKGVAKKYQSYWLKQPSPQRHEMQSGDLSRALRSICLYFWSRVRWYMEDEAVLVLTQLLRPRVPVGVGHDWVAELNLQIVKFYFILFFGCAGSSFLVWSMSSRYTGFSRYSMWAQWLRLTGLVTLWHVGFSSTCDWTGIPCVAKWTQPLNHQGSPSTDFSLLNPKQIFSLS